MIPTQMNHLLIKADARTIPLADRSVHCVVTSPPYYGLRDYGTGRWEGGDPECEHKPNAQPRSTRPVNGLTGGTATVDAATILGNRCHCGARRIDAQLGLEASPDAYVAKMVEVFREVKRVLRDDGTCWVNMGDTFNSSPSNQQGRNGTSSGLISPKYGQDGMAGTGRSKRDVPGLKPKDLLGMPWRLAFALQADGWYLRSDIIWAKPNPMPESVRDRPTKAHEYVFLLTKRERYYYDGDAIKEKSRQPGRISGATNGHVNDLNGHNKDGLSRNGTKPNPAGRNARSVFTIPSHPFKGAHFATMPLKLAARCVKAGTSKRGVCSKCGGPWERVVEREGAPPDQTRRQKHLTESLSLRTGGLITGGAKSTTFGVDAERMPKSLTLGWHPTCSCSAPAIPAVVFDPFAGAGSTLVAAAALGRSAIGLDLSPAYLTMARQRIERPHARHPRERPDESPGPLFAHLANMEPT